MFCACRDLSRIWSWWAKGPSIPNSVGHWPGVWGPGAALGPHWGPGATPRWGVQGGEAPREKMGFKQYLTENLALLTHRIYRFYFDKFIKCDRIFKILLCFKFWLHMPSDPSQYKILIHVLLQGLVTRMHAQWMKTGWMERYSLPKPCINFL